MQPDSEWQNARAHGLALPEVQQTIPLKEAITVVAQIALGWSAREGHRLDMHQIQFLESLVLSDEDTS